MTNANIFLITFNTIIMKLRLIIIITCFCYGNSFSQNVGIGTLTPSKKLQVVTSETNAEIAYFQSTGGYGSILSGNGAMFSDLGVNGSYGFCGTSSPQDFKLRTGGVSRMTLNHANGYVGIGTDFPLTNLHVQGSFQVTDNLRIGTENSLAKLHLLETGPNPILGDFEGEGGSRYLHITNGITSSNIGATETYGFAGTVQNFDFALTTSNTPKLFVKDATGNVGIGTSTPVAKLDVNGTTHLGDKVAIGTNTPQHFLDVQAGGEWAIARFRNNNPDNANIGVTNGTGLVDFGLNNEGGFVGSVTAGDFMIRTNYTVRMFFKNSNGYVGVGTSLPTQRLHVDGNVLITGNLIVDAPTNATLLNGWFVYDASFGTPQFSKDKQGRVLLSGLAEHAPTLGGVIFTLPAGYRPEKSMYFLAASDHPNGFSKILINHTTGDVSVVATASNITWVSFDNVMFRGI